MTDLHVVVSGNPTDGYVAALYDGDRLLGTARPQEIDRNRYIWKWTARLAGRLLLRRERRRRNGAYFRILR